MGNAGSSFSLYLGFYEYCTSLEFIQKNFYSKYISFKQSNENEWLVIKFSVMISHKLNSDEQKKNIYNTDPSTSSPATAKLTNND